MTIQKFLAMAAKYPGRYQCIKKFDALGREMWLGCERASKRSNKYREKFLFPKPIFADELEHRKAERRERDRLAARVDGAGNLSNDHGGDAAASNAVVGIETVRSDAPGREPVPSAVANEGNAHG